MSENGEDKQTLINATEMAKAFNRLVADWIRQRSSSEFLATLASDKGIPITELITVNQGDTQQGTWMHKDVAIEFALWLSPT